MLNDVAITGMTAATDEYLKIINILKRENLIDVIGLQAHAFEFIPGVTNAPTIPGHPYVPVDDMARAQGQPRPARRHRHPDPASPSSTSTGSPVDGVAGRRDAAALLPQRRPHLLGAPGVEGVTLWGWRQPNHWRNAQNAPIVLSNDTLKPAGAWLFNYVRGIAPVIRPDQASRSATATRTASARSLADDWASQMGRPELRTFTWRITGGNGAGVFAIAPSTGELRVANPQLLDENTTYSLKVRVSDGFHESAETTVTVDHRGPRERRRPAAPAAPCPPRSR